VKLVLELVPGKLTRSLYPTLQTESPTRNLKFKGDPTMDAE